MFFRHFKSPSFLFCVRSATEALFWRSNYTDVPRRDSEFILKAAAVGAGNHEAVRKNKESDLWMQ